MLLWTHLRALSTGDSLSLSNIFVMTGASNEVMSCSFVSPRAVLGRWCEKVSSRYLFGDYHPRLCFPPRLSGFIFCRSPSHCCFCGWLLSLLLPLLTLNNKQPQAISGKEERPGSLRGSTHLSLSLEPFHFLFLSFRSGIGSLSKAATQQVRYSGWILVG
jgi:hypothetical protein